ncbi:dihydrolipoamide acetyltransferase family protein [Cumulibacter soli]|uniref:dihydrolipoamide acetyltransferase family protein n=1 Tax=Cumulibacter soli TaxID=2546344 RepID=UPI001067857F|nr:dihydrolipoamide acetyltransferase family protein [Cumulibacter soli]
MTESQIKLPDVGEGVAQAEVVQWHIAAGDTLELDQPMVDVMTDKATVELPAPASGIVTRLAAAVGDFVPVGGTLLWIEESDTASTPDAALPATEAITTATADPSSDGVEPPVEPASPAPSPAATATPAATADTDAPRPRAAPAVRRRAADLGLDLGDVSGTGPDGRVVHADLDALLRAQPPTLAGARAVTDVPLTGLRRHIARRMQEAHRIPHFSYVEEADVGAVEDLRARLNSTGDTRLTLLPFLMRAVCIALRDFPQLNARYDHDAETLEVHDAVHLGIATQTPNGLLVPVVRNADAADISTNAAAVRDLSEAAVEARIALSDLTGSTITITSLGARGGLVSTPIINAPEVAIIGVNRIREQLTLHQGQVRTRRVMNLSSSFDHRVVDGADAAGFIARIIELLEAPALLWLDQDR